MVNDQRAILRTDLRFSRILVDSHGSKILGADWFANYARGDFDWGQAYSLSKRAKRGDDLEWRDHKARPDDYYNVCMQCPSRKVVSGFFFDGVITIRAQL